MLQSKIDSNSAPIPEVQLPKRALASTPTVRALDLTPDRKAVAVAAESPF